LSQTIHEIRLDQTRRLAAQPGKGHNRWHPAIPPVLRINPGDEAILDTLDALDCQIGASSGIVEAAE
jgi:formamidase